MAILRVRPKPVRNRSHPTRDRLIAAVAHLLETHIPEALTADMILTEAGTGKSSLYHHFEDLADLIETVLIAEFTHVVDDNVVFLRKVMETAANRADMLDQLKILNSWYEAPARRKARMDRVRLIVFSQDNPRLAAKLAAEQGRRTQAYAHIIQTGIDRNLISANVDPHVLAVFIQAYTIGKMVDDISTEHVPDASWGAFVLKFLARVSADGFAADD